MSFKVVVSHHLEEIRREIIMATVATVDMTAEVEIMVVRDLTRRVDHLWLISIYQKHL